MLSRGSHAGRAAVAIAAVAGVFGAAPGVAMAAEVELVGNVIEIRAGAGEANQIGLTPTALHQEIVISDFGAAPLTAVGPECTGAGPVTCDKGAPPFDPLVDSIDADLGDMNDSISKGDVSLPLFVDGGFGDDSVNGGLGPDTFMGGSGDDALSGGEGDNDLGGGGDDDFLSSAGPTDVVRGGGGLDTVLVQFDPAPPPASLTVTLDDLNDDGDVGDTRNIRSDVEDVRVSTAVGDDAFLRGSDGTNAIVSGAGKEDVDPGDGPDSVSSGGGDDIIDTVDGFADVVACGLGNDDATVDQLDVVFGCETATVQQVTPGGGGGGGGGGGQPQTITQVVQTPGPVQVVEAARDGTAPAFRSFSTPARLNRRQLRRGVLVQFSSDEASSAEIALSGRLRRGTVARVGDVVLAERRLGSGTGTRSVRVKLGRRALRNLPRRGRVRIRVQVTLVDAAGNRRTQTRTVTIR